MALALSFHLHHPALGVRGDPAEHGAGVAWGAVGPGGLAGLCRGISLHQEPTSKQKEEKPGSTSTTTVSHQPEEEQPGRARCPAQPPWRSRRTLGGRGALVGSEDDGARRGADVGRRCSEQGWSEERGLEEGGGSGWSQGEGARHGAHGRGERAGEEAGGQRFGEVLLQSQLGLRGGRRREGEAARRMGQAPLHQ